jgi:chemotaxis protein MotB
MAGITAPGKEKPPRPRIKKVVGHGGGHHGGSWKVAYADFVTAMMALFLVLWLVSQGDHKLKQNIASYFRAPGAFDTTVGNLFPSPSNPSEPSITTIMSMEDDEKALESTAQLLRKRFSRMASKDQVKVEITGEGLHIQVIDKAETVSFESGSASLTPAARAILEEIARTICKLPNLIQLGGHTDAYTYPNRNYTNWELSADRANAARRELEAHCVKPERIQRIVGYADTQLYIPDNPYSPANRRISIMVLWLNKPSQELLDKLSNGDYWQDNGTQDVDKDKSKKNEADEVDEEEEDISQNEE